MKTVPFSEITARSDNGFWVRLLIEEETGWVVILSDYGNWSYRWTHIGTRTLTEFLVKLDSGYMGGKMLGAGISVYSHSATEECIREDIAKNSIIATLDRQTERDLLEKFADGEFDFNSWCEQTSYQEPWEFSRTEMDSSWSNFWEHLWEPHIVPQLQK